MPTSVEQATGAARSFRIGGVEYWITPIPSRTWGEYIGWLKDEFLNTIKRNVKDLEPEDRKSILQRAFEKVGRLELGDPELKGVSGSPAGVYRLVRLHLLARHPEMTEEEVASLLNNPELQRLALEAIEKTLPEKGGEHPKRKRRTGTKLQRKKRPRSSKKRR